MLNIIAYYISIMRAMHVFIRICQPDFLGLYFELGQRRVRAKIKFFQFFFIIYFCIRLVENIVFFVAQICTAKAVLAIFAVTAQVYVAAVMAIMIKKALIHIPALQ